MSGFDDDEISRPLTPHFDMTAAAAPTEMDDVHGESDDLDRYALHENTAAATAPVTGSGGIVEDDGLLLNFGLQSTARPLVTPPTVSSSDEKESTMIHLTPDDLSSSIRGEPFVNVTKGGSSYGDDDDVVDDDDSRPSAPPDSPTTAAANLQRHPNPYRYTEEDEEDDLDQFDPLKEDARISHAQPNDDAIYAANDKPTEHNFISEDKMAEQHDQIDEIDHDQYLNGDFVAPPIVHDDRSSPVVVDSDSACKQCCPLNSLGAWFKADNLDPRVADLIYWRDIKKSGGAFGIGLVLLLSLAYYSLISVVAHLLLGVMIGTLSYRIYKTVLQAVQKSNDGHPFKAYLDIDLNLPSEKVHEVSEIAVKHLECALHELRRLFLVEDLVDSIKFALLMWCFTYIGAWFNGLTLFILAFVSLFTLPKVYETHKTEIDRYIAIATAQIHGVISKVKAKIPIGKKQKEQ